MFRVTMTFGGKPIKKFTFDKEQVAIGRDAGCEIQVENIGASRRHALIEKTGEGFVLSDLQSHNGTFVNGEKIFHHKLREQDEFYIGKYAFQFEALEPVVEHMTEQMPQSAPSRQEMPDMTFRLDRKEIEKIIGMSQRGAQSQLAQIAPEGAKKNWGLDKGYYLVGSDEACEIKTPGFFMPGKAGILVRTETGWRAIALSPKFRVNAKEIADAPLVDGDLVSVGKHRFRFCQG